MLFGVRVLIPQRYLIVDSWTGHSTILWTTCVCKEERSGKN
jgi:hypothetical protein